MKRRTDMIAVMTFVAERFGIYTSNPTRLGEFARDLLASGIQFTAYQLNLRESLERVSKW